MEFVKIPSTLKVEHKKSEFIKEVKVRLSGIQIKENLLEVIIVLMNMAEEYFLTKKHRKYGKEKKECVMQVLKDMLGGSYEAEMISRMIETLVHSKNIKKIGFIKKTILWVKKKLLMK
jgi:hypothetical protein